MNQGVAIALNAQHVLTQQVALLAGDGPFEQEEVYSQLEPTKMPDLKAFTDSNAAQIYASRLRAYDILSKTIERHQAEHISETHQTMLITALRRDLSPFLTHFGGTATQKSTSSSPASNLTALNNYLYVLDSSLPLECYAMPFALVTSPLSAEKTSTFFLTHSSRTIL